LSPTHALFREADYLLREDPRLTDRALYHSIITAIAKGATTPTEIGAAVGRPAQSLAYPLSVLESAGFVDRIDDVLLQRRPRLLLADPIIRFHQLVTAPRLAMLEEGHAEAAWRGAAATFASKILGPHFERLARSWVALHGREEGLREATGIVGPTVVNDPVGRTRHEIDVVGLAEGQAPRSRNPRVVLLGEAKHSARRLTASDLARLERLRDLLVGRGVDAGDAQLALFTRSGTDAQLARAVAHRNDVVVVDLRRLYSRASES
ncbi:MAG: ATP-binding protein, partial [Candidatus Binatia bacterium]